MIILGKDCEYTTLIADFIEELSKLDEFQVNIWISNTELPFEFDESSEFLFLQEGLKISKWNYILYIFYDLISLIEVRDKT